MDRENRKKREKPERSQPERDFSHLFGAFGGTQQEHQRQTSDSSSSWSDNVNHGVNLGYRVIEEQIRQGQRIAQQINSGSYDAGAMNNDMQGLAKNVQRYCEETVQLYSKIFESFASDMPGRGSGGGIGDSHSAAPTSAQIVVKVASKQAVEITINLQKSSDNPYIDRLHASAIDKPPITDISLAQEADGKIRLHIAITDEHPAGDYSGVVYDSESKVHIGTLGITIPE